MPKTICIVGGGAAGFFAAIECARKAREIKAEVRIVLLEGSTRYLQKVRISGGGRCNVTHHDFNLRSFCTRYPRGQKEVLSPMSQFQAKDLVTWFESLGVKLKVEEDGRMFPITDRSETIIGCLQTRAHELGVESKKGFFVDEVVKKEGLFFLKQRSGETLASEVLMLATGSSASGYKMAKDLGHNITPLAPSLFSFKIAAALLSDLQGTSFPNASAELVLPGGKRFNEQAPVLITHWGLSGPGILKISAWAAREMKACGYKANLVVNWVGKKEQEIVDEFQLVKNKIPKLSIANMYIEGVTKRFWKKILSVENVHDDAPVGEVSNKKLFQLANALTQTKLVVDGKNRFKDEFVECGGVNLKEIHMKTMQSKIVDGLFFGGEIMDVDGVTGGFNLQHAWTSGWVAGQNMV